MLDNPDGAVQFDKAFSELIRSMFSVQQKVPMGLYYSKARGIQLKISRGAKYRQKIYIILGSVQIRFEAILNGNHPPIINYNSFTRQYAKPEFEVNVVPQHVMVALANLVNVVFGLSMGGNHKVKIIAKINKTVDEVSFSASTDVARYELPISKSVMMDGLRFRKDTK